LIAGRGVSAASLSRNSTGSKRRCVVPSLQTRFSCTAAARHLGAPAVRAFERLGYEVVRQKGNHLRLRKFPRLATPTLDHP
jgi:hypothetical protein